MKNPKISVIIPIYNVKKYLKFCLESVLNQVFQDFEVICVEDKSTDGSVDVLKEYQENDRRISIVYHEKNKGLSAARNTGLKVARGDYIFFLDADDMIQRETLGDLYVCAVENDTEVLCFEMKKISEEMKTYVGQRENISLKCSRLYEGKEFFSEKVTMHSFDVTSCSKLCKRKFLLENDIWFYEGIYHEDYLFSFYCMMCAEKVAYLKRSYYGYRQRPNSIVNSTLGKKRAKSYQTILIELMKYWNENSFSKDVNEAIYSYTMLIYKQYMQAATKSIANEKLEDWNLSNQFFYSLLSGSLRLYDWIKITENDIKKLQNAECVLVYGAGKVALATIQLLKDNGVKIRGIIVSSMEKNPCKLYDIEVHEISYYNNYNYQKVTVVLGMSQKNSSEVKNKIKMLDVQDVVEVKEIFD